MNKREFAILAALVGVFVFAYYVNFASDNVRDAIMEAFYMLQWYARYYTLACVVPAMFIASFRDSVGLIVCPFWQRS